MIEQSARPPVRRLVANAPAKCDALWPSYLGLSGRLCLGQRPEPRLHDLASADSSILNITYQVKYPVKIVTTNADIIGENNIAIWNIPYGKEKQILIEGKKTKFLSYFLVVILGILGLLILFFIFALLFSSRLKRKPARTRSNKTYDNYFKRDRYFNDDESDEL